MTTAVGAWSLAQKYLADTLAACAQWQSWVGAASEAQALARIHQDALPQPRHGNDYSLDELRGFRPYALIWTEDEDGFRSARAGVGTFVDGGVLMVRIEDDIPEAIEDDPAEIALRIRNHTGTLIAELLAKHETAGCLAIEAVTVNGPFRTHPDELETMGDAQIVELRCEWGTTEE